jgi:myo-inositol-1(or 4)-monophosphatase
MPSTGDLYAAGETTATLDDEPTAVSSRTDPERFTVAAVGWWPPERRAEMGRLCGEIGRRFAELRRIGSFQTTLAYVASGGLDAAVATGRNHPWDTVGGVHCVRRAGGVVTDLDGDRWRHDSEGLVASNGADHDAVLAAARAAVEG